MNIHKRANIELCICLVDIQDIFRHGISQHVISTKEPLIRQKIYTIDSQKRALHI